MRICLLRGKNVVKSILSSPSLATLGLALTLGASSAFASEPPAPAGPTVVTSISQFWNLKPEEKAKPLELRLECDVTYYDPIWRILFVQDSAGNGAYVPYGALNFPFKAGQRLMATGTLMPPNVDVSFEHALVSVLGEAHPSAVRAAGRLANTEELRNRLITVEGFVDKFRVTDTVHLELTLSVEGRSIVAWVPVPSVRSVPDLADATVEVTGVYNPKVGPDGNFTALEIMVPGLDSIRITSRLANDPRFQGPVVPIGSLAKRPRSQLVRIAGRVKAQQSGQLITLRDDTGQIDVMSGQTRSCAIDDQVEAVGYPQISGTDWKLLDAIFRVSGAPATTILPPPSTTLRMAAQVLELSPVEAAERRPVWLTGVVTWSHPDSPFFFLQDSSGGVCVQRGGSAQLPISPGRNVEVRGVTQMGAYAPQVVASRFDKLSELVLPLATPVSLEHALTGAEEGRWVEMSGYLRQVRREGAWNTLELATAAGDFLAVLPGSENAAGLVGAVVRVHGVCTAVANENHKLTGIKLWVPQATYVQVEEPAPGDPFDLPHFSLASLGQFSGLPALNHRLRVSGIVLHQSPGHSVHIADGDESLLVYSRSTAPLLPGDRIEAAGFVGRQGGRVILREAVCRRTGPGAEPAARRLGAVGTASLDLDGRLVRIEGTVINRVTVERGPTRLTLANGRTIFEAGLETGGLASDLAAGSRLALTGVYEVKFDEFGRPAGFQLLLRTPADLQVLERPPWLTRERILAVATALVAAVVLFVAWITALRRQVGAQTRQIRDQVQREARLHEELQRASKLESLGLLAGGLAHDFNNLLTVVMGNLSLVRLDSSLGADSAEALRDAEKASLAARDLTQQLLTFAKGGAPIRAAVALPDVVREVAEFVLRGSNVRCRFDIPDGVWSANVDRSQIGQVVQNIAINALQAMPGGGLLDIALANTEVGSEFAGILAAGRYVRLTLTDHGTGIPEADLPKIFFPYFTTKRMGSGLGLATVYSIVKKHHGHVIAESTLGQGTTFRVWLPAAEDAAAPGEKAAARPPSAPPFPARVLVMDDEPAIRRLGTAILERMGHQVVAVADGAEAVRTYVQARAEGRRFDLAILDLTIPGGMGGLEALQQILASDPEARAIVSSGYSHDSVLADFRSHGFRGRIVKPFEVAEFTRAVNEVLRG